MKKIMTAICCALCIALATTSFTTRASDRQITANKVDYNIIINGEHMAFSYPLLSMDNRVYVSIRELSEILGYEVLWNGQVGEITMSDENYRDEMFDTSQKGTLPNGARYEFRGRGAEDFNLREHRETWEYSREEPLTATVVARTSAEAAENGQRYMRVQGLEKSETAFILVRYCTEADSWVLRVEWDDSPINMPGGPPGLLVISRTSGSMVMYTRPYA